MEFFITALGNVFSPIIFINILLGVAAGIIGALHNTSPKLHRTLSIFSNALDISKITRLQSLNKYFKIMFLLVLIKKTRKFHKNHYQ